MATKYTKWMYIVQMAIKYTQHRPLQDPRKFTRIWIFGFRINYLATLIRLFLELMLPKGLVQVQECENIFVVGSELGVPN
jgi:hypothetical protein